MITVIDKKIVSVTFLNYGQVIGLETNYNEPIILVDNKYFMPIYEYNINNQHIYVARIFKNAVDRERSFFPSHITSNGEEIFSTKGVSRTYIKKLNTLEKKEMYETTVLISKDKMTYSDIQNKIEPINLWIYSEKKLNQDMLIQCFNTFGNFFIDVQHV
jgi:hypothetical protein